MPILFFLSFRQLSNKIVEITKAISGRRFDKYLKAPTSFFSFVWRFIPLGDYLIGGIFVITQKAFNRETGEGETK